MAVSREEALAILKERGVKIPEQVSMGEDLRKNEPVSRIPSINEKPRKEPSGFQKFGHELFYGEPEQHPGKFMSGVTGFNTAFSRLTEGLLQPLLRGQPGFENTAKQREKAYDYAREENPKSALGGNIAGNVAASLPFFAGGELAAARLAPSLGNYGRGVLGGTIGGAAEGASQYVNPEESRLMNTLMGATVGGGLSAVAPPIYALGKGAIQGIPKAWNALKKHAGSEEHITKDMLKHFTKEEMELALKNQEIAKKMGLHLTPSEAAESPIGAANVEGQIGKTPQGQRDIYVFRVDQQGKQKEAIEESLDIVSPIKENANEKVRNLAQSVIKGEEEALQKRAAPFYEHAYKETVPANSLNKLLQKDGNIETAFKKVLTAPSYKREIAGHPANGIKVLDRVKREIDAKIAKAARDGNKDLVRRLQESKKSLVSLTDKHSKYYPKARKIYEEGSPDIDLLRKREVGKIADIKDVNLKNVPSVIFDPKQSDLKTLETMRKALRHEDPDAWDTLVRSEMERLSTGKNVGKSGHHGSNFFNNALADEKVFKRLHAALKGNPKAQKRLTEMKAVFKNLINEPNVKSAAALSKTSMSHSREAIERTNRIVANLTGGKYDKAAIDIITSDKWEKAFEKALHQKSPVAKRNALAEVLMKAKKNVINEKNLEKVHKATTRAATGKTTETKGNHYLKTASGYEISD
jgi:hypothetical protein